MNAFLRRVGLRRASVGAGVMLGLLLVAATALSLASSGTALPFALSAAPGAAPTATLGPASATPPSEPTAASAGCGAAPPAAPGATVSQTLSVGQLERRYRLHIPREYLPNVHTPLVLAFHGHGGTAAPFERFTRLSQFADEHGFIAAYPQGVVGPDGQTGWNTSRQKDPRADDVGFVNDLITQLQDTLCVDPERIYATGFSNGGGFVAVLACDLSDRIAAFAPVAGDYYPQPGGCHPPRAVSLLEIHGTADTINPYNGSAQLRYPAVGAWLQNWATRDGCAGQPVLQVAATGVVVETWSGCQDGASILHDRLVDVGHIWLNAATTPSGPARAATFDTDTTIWSFFATQQLPIPA